MERKIMLTADGSHTILVPDLDMTYHSKHGAMQESVHVFIEAGLRHWVQLNGTRKVSIFELGFGTGLNALLTSLEAHKHDCEIHYTTIEPLPLDQEILTQLNHSVLLSNQESQVQNEEILKAPWEQDKKIHDNFTIIKHRVALADYTVSSGFDVIYFDAFSPTAQPELWSHESFEKILGLMNPGGLLTTYCSRSIVRHTMTDVGFRVEKIQGPWGKREMVRAYKY